MHHKLCVLYHGHLPIEERPSTKEEHKMKLEDWEKDVAPLRNFDFVSNKMLDKDPTQSLTLNKFGTPIMTRKHFVSSWFHMADMWTDNISSELYTNFLKFTLSKIAVVNQHGVLEWRSDQSISTLMTDHYMTEEEKEIKRQQRQEQQEQEYKASKTSGGRNTVFRTLMKTTAKAKNLGLSGSTGTVVSCFFVSYL